MPRLSIVPPSCVLSNNCNHRHKKHIIQMVHYQSIPAATPHANAEQDDYTVKIHKSVMVWRISGAVLILFVGLAGFATTHTYRSGKSIIAGTTAATALLRSTTTTGGFTNPIKQKTVMEVVDNVLARYDDHGPDHDHCCAPATGTWVGLHEDDDWGNYSDDAPFETCYTQTNCDVAALMDLVSSCYCWSKSFYDVTGKTWSECSPAGGRNWQQYDASNIGRKATIQTTFCGEPCQEFETTNENVEGSVPTCPP